MEPESTQNDTRPTRRTVTSAWQVLDSLTEFTPWVVHGLCCFDGKGGVWEDVVIEEGVTSERGMTHFITEAANAAAALAGLAPAPSRMREDLLNLADLYQGACAVTSAANAKRVAEKLRAAVRRLHSSSRETAIRLSAEPNGRSHARKGSRTTVEAAQAWAEKHVKRYGFPGVNALAAKCQKALGSCSPSTMAKAVAQSHSLTRKKQERDINNIKLGGHPISLTSKTLATHDNSVEQPHTKADMEPVLHKLLRAAAPEQRDAIQGMSLEEQKTLVSTYNSGDFNLDELPLV